MASTYKCALLLLFAASSMAANYVISGNVPYFYVKARSQPQLFIYPNSVLRVEDPTSNIVCRYITKEDYNLLLTTGQLPPTSPQQLNSFSFQGVSIRDIFSRPWNLRKFYRYASGYQELEREDSFPAGSHVFPGLCTSPENPRPFPILFGTPPHVPQQEVTPPVSIEELIPSFTRYRGV